MRTRQRWFTVLATALAAAGCGSSPPAHDSTPRTSPHHRPPAASQPAVTTATLPEGFVRWPARRVSGWPAADARRRRADLAWSAQLAVTGGLIVASHSCGNSIALCRVGSPVLESVDLATGRRLAVSANDAMVAVGDGRVWAVPVAGGDRLVALDPRTLRPAGPAVRLPGRAVTAAVAGRVVWVGAGRRLVEVSSSSRSVVRSLPARVDDVVVSPDGRTLWTVAPPVGEYGRWKVQRRSAASGAVEETWRAQSGIVGLGGLSADDAGVWAGEGGGMTTVLARLAGRRLRVTVQGGEPMRRGGLAHFDLVGEPIVAVDAPRVLWADLSGQAVECLPPDGTAARSRDLVDTISNIVVVGRRLVVADLRGIEVITPPAACFPAG